MPQIKRPFSLVSLGEFKVGWCIKEQDFFNLIGMTRDYYLDADFYEYQEHNNSDDDLAFYLVDWINSPSKYKEDIKEYFAENSICDEILIGTDKEIFLKQKKIELDKLERVSVKDLLFMLENDEYVKEKFKEIDSEGYLRCNQDFWRRKLKKGEVSGGYFIRDMKWSGLSEYYGWYFSVICSIYIYSKRAPTQTEDAFRKALVSVRNDILKISQKLDKNNEILSALSLVGNKYSFTEGLLNYRIFKEREYNQEDRQYLIENYEIDEAEHSVLFYLDILCEMQTYLSVAIDQPNKYGHVTNEGTWGESPDIYLMRKLAEMWVKMGLQVRQTEDDTKEYPNFIPFMERVHEYIGSNQTSSCLVKRLKNLNNRNIYRGDFPLSHSLEWEFSGENINFERTKCLSRDNKHIFPPEPIIKFTDYINKLTSGTIRREKNKSVLGKTKKN